MVPKMRRESNTSHSLFPPMCGGESTQGVSHPSGPTILGAVSAQRWVRPQRLSAASPSESWGRPSNCRVTGVPHCRPTGPLSNTGTHPTSLCGYSPVPPLPASCLPCVSPHLGRESRGRPCPGWNVPPPLLVGTPPPASSVRRFWKYWFMLWVRVV